MLFSALALLALSAGSALAAGDVTATTDTVGVNFLGASGGIKFFLNEDDTKFIMVKQNKLQELNEDGSKCTGSSCGAINVAGQVGLKRSLLCL